MPVTTFVFAGQFNPQVPVLPGTILATLPGRQVAVRRVSDGQLATIYTSRLKAATSANPVVIDADGNLSFFTDPGAYTLHLVLAGGAEGVGLPVTVEIDPLEAGTDTDLVALQATVSALGDSQTSMAAALALIEAAGLTSPPASSGVRYAAPWGNDTNDGLSWSKPKLTILAAYDAVALIGGGTVYIAHNTTIGGEVAGQGIWLYGSGSSPGAGWRASVPISLIGVGGRADPGAGVTQGIPMAQVLGFSGTNAPVHLFGTRRFHAENLYFQYPGRGIHIGSTPGTFARQDTTITVGSTWRNVKVDLNSGNGVDPVVNIKGGLTFWHWFVGGYYAGRQTVAGVPQSVTADKAFAMLIDGAYFWYVIDSMFVNGGGVRCYPPGSSASGYMARCTMEADFVNPSTPLLNLVGNPGAGSIFSFSDLLVADAATFSAAVLIESAIGTLQTNPYASVRNVSGGVKGAARIENIDSGYTTDVGNPYLNNQIGFRRGRVFGQVMDARRNVPGAVVRYRNLVQSDVLNGGWGGGAVAVSDPFGGSRARRVTALSGRQGITTSGGSPTWAVGDRIVGGVWVKPADRTIGPGADFALQAEIQNGTGGYANGLRLTMPMSDGEWVWLSGTSKITTVGTPNPGPLSMFLNSIVIGSDTFARDYYGPVLFRVPVADGMTDAEAAELAQSLASYSHVGNLDEFMLVPSLGLATHVGSHTVYTSAGAIQTQMHSSGYIELLEMTAPAAPATNRARLFLEDNGSGKSRVGVQFSTGAKIILATEP